MKVIPINVEVEELVFDTEIITNTEDEADKIVADPAQQELLDSLTEIIADIIPDNHISSIP